MDFNSPIAARYVRIVAIISLLLGLYDASRLLGVSGRAEDPLVTFGAAGFAYLATFALAQLFAAVGLWIRSSWGGVILIAATTLQLGMFLFGNGDIQRQMTPLGFAVRLVLLIAMTLILVLGMRFNRDRAHD